MPRELPAIVSTRMLAQERARVRALAELKGATVSETVRRILVPEVQKQLEEAAREPAEAVA